MKPYYVSHDGTITIYHGDCRDVLPTLPPASVDLLLTDPPYGVGKAKWDDEFPVWWLDEGARVAKTAIAVMPGNANILALPQAFGEFRYAWTLSCHISNALVRGAIGFGNWIPCLVYARVGSSIYTCNQDAGQVAIRGQMPAHPSPKPYDAMRWFVSRLPGDSILDPFMGSGTTLRAAMDLGRRAIGVEIEERYCEVAARRLEQMPMPLAVPA